MLSMLKAHWHYLAKSNFTLAAFVVLALLCSFEAIAVWMHLHVPWFTELGMVVGIHDGVPSLALWGSSFVGGAFAPMFVSILVAASTVDLFSHGYVKNLLQAKGGRASFAFSLSLVCVAMAVLSTAVGIVVTEVGMRIAGCVPALPSPGDFLQWFVQVALCVSAYAVLTLLVVFVTKKQVIGIIAALFVGGGMVESLLQFVLANIPSLSPAIRDCLDGYLAADVSVLASGGICDPLSYAQSIGTILVGAALCVLVMRRRSVG